ncbi:unnamed protein product, partial [Mesorhabditis belari]|uniref:Uncharacterized protein n=1 Tax=Mesorhabditis belari TaxID=2138241 RepID=A0AAF3J569_9BILA
MRSTMRESCVMIVLVSSLLLFISPIHSTQEVFDRLRFRFNNAPQPLYPSSISSSKPERISMERLQSLIDKYRNWKAKRPFEKEVTQI